MQKMEIEIIDDDEDEEEQKTALPQQPQRQSILDDHYRTTKRSTSDPDKVCGKCLESLKEDLKEMAQFSSRRKVNAKEFCVRCKMNFHQKCFGKKGQIICQSCADAVQAAIPSSNKTLLEYFSATAKHGRNHLNNTPDGKSSGKKPTTRDSCVIIEEVPVRLRSPVSSIFTWIASLFLILLLERSEDKLPTQSKPNRFTRIKKRKMFKLPKMCPNAERAFELKQSLAKALISRNIIFDDDLYFGNRECTPDTNDASMEPTLQVNRMKSFWCV
jgi:hypothetical protein